MRALVVGESGGIGGALVAAMAARDWQVVGLSRRHDGLDVTDEASVDRVMSGLEGTFDRIFVATGVLEHAGVGPEKSLRTVTPQTLMAQFAINAAGPFWVLKHAARLLPRDRPAQFAALSARVGSIGDNALGGWYSYRAAKAALNQLVHTAAIELARSHPQSLVVTLHPGHVATQLSQGYGGSLPATSPQAAALSLMAVLDRLTPQETGGFFDWAGQRVDW